MQIMSPVLDTGTIRAVLKDLEEKPSGKDWFGIDDSNR